MEFDKLTPQEKTEYVGKLVHAVQTSTSLYLEGIAIIKRAERMGLFNNVIINPSTEEQNMKS